MINTNIESTYGFREEERFIPTTMNIVKEVITLDNRSTENEALDSNQQASIDELEEKIASITENMPLEYEGDEYIQVEKADGVVKITSKILPISDAVAKSTEYQNVTFTDSEGESETVLNRYANDDNNEYKAWRYNDYPMTYYTIDFPEEGSQFMLYYMENGEYKAVGDTPYLLKSYVKTEVEEVNGIVSALGVQQIVGNQRVYSGVVVKLGDEPLNMTYNPQLNVVKDGVQYYGHDCKVDDYDYVIHTTQITDLKTNDPLTIHLFVDQQKSEEILEEDIHEETTVVNVLEKTSTGLYKYVDDAIDNSNIDIDTDVYIDSEIEGKKIILATKVVPLDNADKAYVECFLMKVDAEGTTGSVYIDLIRATNFDDLENNYFAWRARLMTEDISSSDLFYTKFIPSDDYLGDTFKIYKYENDAYAEYTDFKQNTIIAINNTYVSGAYSSQDKCKVDKGYGYTITIGKKKTFTYWPFYTFIEPFKEGNYYAWHGYFVSGDTIMWYSTDYPTEIGQEIEMYYKEDDEIKLSECVYTVSRIDKYSNYHKVGLAAAYDVKEHILSAESRVQNAVDAVDDRVDALMAQLEQCIARLNVLEGDSITKFIYEDGSIITRNIAGNLQSSDIDVVNLVAVKIGNTVTTINARAFNGCTTLTSVTIPDSVTTIEHSAFMRCTGLTNVEIPNSVTNINGSTFFGCTSLTSVTIPNSVTTINDSAFALCSSLTSVTIPDSVTSIDDTVFESCENLTEIHYSGTATGFPWGADNATLITD